MAKSRHAMAARGPQARVLPWRAEMQPNCPGYQERLCLSSWNRYSTRTGKARKNRTRKESFLARKNDRNFQPCEIANIRALGRRFAISHGSNQLIQCWRSKFRSKVQGYMWDRRISQRSSVYLIGQCHGYRHVTYDNLRSHDHMYPWTLDRNLLRQHWISRFEPCEIANLRPRADICNLTWLKVSVVFSSWKAFFSSSIFSSFTCLSRVSVPWW